MKDKIRNKAIIIKRVVPKKDENGNEIYNDKGEIVKKVKITKINRVIYDTERNIVDLGLFNESLNIGNYEQRDASKFNNSIDNKLRILDNSEIDSLYNYILSLNSSNDKKEFVEKIKEISYSAIKKDVINNHLRVINSILKQLSLPTLYDYKKLNIKLVDEQLAKTKQKTISSYINDRVENDRLVELLSENEDLLVASFINRVIINHYDRIISNYDDDTLEELNISFSKGDIKEIDKIYDGNKKTKIEEYSKEVISDLVYSKYGEKLCHICWLEGCSNADVINCTRIADCGLDLRNPKYKYVLEGIMFTDEDKKVIDRSVVLNCTHYTRTPYVPKKAGSTEKLLEKINEKEASQAEVRSRMAELHNSTSGKIFSNLEGANYTLSETDKANMSSMNERKRIVRNNELVELKKLKEEIINESKTNKQKTKRRTKKDI